MRALFCSEELQGSEKGRALFRFPRRHLFFARRRLFCPAERKDSTACGRTYNM